MVALVTPSYALSLLGFKGTGDPQLFPGPFPGAVMVPRGVGLVLAGRRSGPTRVWTAAGLVNAIAAVVVLVFFLGRGTVEWGRMWPRSSWFTVSRF